MNPWSCSSYEFYSSHEVYDDEMVFIQILWVRFMCYCREIMWGYPFCISLWSWIHVTSACYVFNDITDLWYSDCMSKILSSWFCVELPWGGSGFWYCIGNVVFLIHVVWPSGLFVCSRYLVDGVGWDLRSLHDAYDVGTGRGVIPLGETAIKWASMDYDIPWVEGPKVIEGPQYPLGERP
jgi:hypothetical protein